MLSRTILPLHLSFLYFNQIPPQLSLLSLKLNSSLRTFLLTLFWMILGIFLLLLHPLTTLSLRYNFFIMTSHYALSSLDSRKSYGPDGIPPVVLKNCVSELSPCLVKFFRVCLSTSTYPYCWTSAHIQPIPKRGHSSNLSN